MFKINELYPKRDIITYVLYEETNILSVEVRRAGGLLVFL